MLKLADTCAVCAKERRQSENKPPTFKQMMPLVCARLLRAAADKINL
jgi:hypothetical protein